MYLKINIPIGFEISWCYLSLLKEVEKLRRSRNGWKNWQWWRIWCVTYWSMENFWLTASWAFNCHCTKKWSFPLGILSVNVTNSAVWFFVQRAKLDTYRFDKSSLKLIQIYLSNRKQRARINDKYRSRSEILFRVPQGPILGPLLFNIFICGYVLSSWELCYCKSCGRLYTTLCG